MRTFAIRRSRTTGGGVFAQSKIGQERLILTVGCSGSGDRELQRGRCFRPRQHRTRAREARFQTAPTVCFRPGQNRSRAPDLDPTKNRKRDETGAPGTDATHQANSSCCADFCRLLRWDAPLHVDEARRGQVGSPDFLAPIRVRKCRPAHPPKSDASVRGRYRR